MTATSHAFTGPVIAAKRGNPEPAIPLTLAYHVAADMIPQWDTASNRKTKSWNRLFIDSAFDGLLALTLSYSILVLLFPSTNYLYALFIIFFAILPDLLHIPYTIFGIKQFKWAYEFGKRTNINLDKPWGVITQIVTVVIVIFLAKIF